MECGGCTECCTAFPVVELKNPAGAPCEYEDKGCKIYHVRPQSCRDCYCLYRTSPTGFKKYRPDKCGVIFEGINPKLVVGTIIREISIDVKDQIEAFKSQGIRVMLQRKVDDSA